MINPIVFWSSIISAIIIALVAGVWLASRAGLNMPGFFVELIGKEQKGILQEDEFLSENYVEFIRTGQTYKTTSNIKKIKIEADPITNEALSVLQMDGKQIGYPFKESEIICVNIDKALLGKGGVKFIIGEKNDILSKMRVQQLEHKLEKAKVEVQVKELMTNDETAQKQKNTLAKAKRQDFYGQGGGFGQRPSYDWRYNRFSRGTEPEASE